MRKVMSKVSLALICCAVMMAGCAKEPLVKNDEPVTAPSSQQKLEKQAPPPQAAKSPVVEEKVASPVISESPVAKEQAATASATTAAVEQIEKQLDAVFFDFDSFALSQPSRDTLSGNASILLKKNAGANIQVEGHCDERGSAEYNLALGERRAKSAMTYLITLGVPANRLSIISFGKEKPADTGHDEAAWAKNRRAEFKVAK